MLKNIFDKTILLFLVALLVGVAGGAIYSRATATAERQYNAAQLTEGLQYTKAEAGRLQCVALHDKVALYNTPSGLNGKIIEYLSQGVKVDYIDTVNSQDKDDSLAIVKQQLKFRRYIFQKHVIPAGTQVRIVREDDGRGETVGRVVVDGKEYELDFATELLQLPYVGQWKQVELNGKPGYVKYNDVSDSKLM